MGKITKDPAKSIVNCILDNVDLYRFIETGTYHGDSLEWALTRFNHVVTIEINSNFQKIAQDRCSDPRVTFLLGDSRECLTQYQLEVPSLIWLDAHSGGGGYNEGDDCPLLTELATIMKSSVDHYIIIDDARAFCWPLGEPFDHTKWPTLNDIVSLVESRYWVSYINDTMVMIPNTQVTRFRSIFSKIKFYGESNE